MRHYEIVFMVHPDHSEQVKSMIEKYSSIIEKKGGKVHRLEDWGRRQLAYPIENLHKAHYVLMNVEAETSSIDEIEENFRYNTIVIRNLVIRKKEAVLEASAMAKMKEERRERSEVKPEGVVKTESTDTVKEDKSDIEEVKEQEDVVEPTES